MTHTIDKLHKLVLERKKGDPETSYTAKLFHKGEKKIAQKMGEEAVEVVIASLKEGRKELIGESADLLFHLMVLWVDKGLTPDEVMKELEARMSQSGLDEKSARKKG